MLSKGMSNILSEIQIGNEVLSRLIDEVPAIYHDNAQRIENTAINEAFETANGDEEIYDTIYRQYDSICDLEMHIENETLKILLVAIFSYYESMIKSLVSFYHVPYNTKKQNVRNLAQKIETYIGSSINCDEEEMLHLLIRVMRNIIQHLKIDKDDENDFLKYKKRHPECRISVFENKIQGLSIEFLKVALASAYTFLVKLESLLYKKTSEIR